MKRIFQFLTALILLGSLTISVAQSPTYPRDLTLCWTHPTHYELEPGQTVAAEIQDGDLDHTRLTGIRHTGESILDQQVPMQGLPGSQQCQTFVGQIPLPGTYTFEGYSVTVDATSSDASNQAVKKYTGKPNPASGLGVQ
jgi:hypothetical protein